MRLQPHRGDRGRPLFVQLALEPLWKAYSAAQPGSDPEVRVSGHKLRQIKSDWAHLRNRPMLLRCWCSYASFVSPTRAGICS